MRKPTCVNLLLATLYLPIALIGQSNARFIAATVQDNAIEQSLDAFFTDYSLVELPTQELEAFLQQNEPYFSIHWVFPNDLNWEMTLEATPLLSGDFSLKIQDKLEKRLVPIDKNQIHTFKAAIPAEEHRLTVHKDFVYGYTIQDGQEWYIEPIKRFAPEADRKAFVVYRNRDVRPIPNLKCGANDKNSAPAIESYARNNRDACYEVDLAIAADYSMFDFYSSPLDVFVQLEGVMNNVAGNFDTEFSDEIHFRISEMLIATCSSCDPWDQTLEASELLVDFHEWGLSTSGFTSTFDLAQFWTRRPLQNNGNGSVIGMAFVGSVCGDNRFHVLEDFSASAGYLRVLTAHEIGHNFGCIHNFNNGDYVCYGSGATKKIMDPSVSTSSIWSDDTNPSCSANSVLRIHNMLATANCLSACEERCSAVYDLHADFDPLTPSLHLEWAADEASSFRVRIRDLKHNTYEAFYTQSYHLDFDNTTLQLCTQYEILVDAQCDNSFGRAMSILVDTEAESQMRITNLQTRSCEIEANSYNLDLFIEYDEVFDEGFTISVNGQNYVKNYTSSPQFVKIEGLPANGQENIEVIVKSNTHTSNRCAAFASYKAPSHLCNFEIEANFDDCQLPPGWTVVDAYGAPTSWQIGDSTRLVVNFINNTGNTTVNGSCMAYFDDDILGPGEDNSGTASLLTPIIDVAGYESIELSLLYNFNTYYSHPNTSFLIDVFDGDQWVNILTDNTGSGCSASNAWDEHCNTFFQAELNEYANDLLRIRFSYSDGGRWAEFVAIDNFMLSAVKDASLLPAEIIQLDAKTAQNHIIIDWTTAQEVNNDFFEIERSDDGRNFTSIGMMPGKGDSQQEQSYSFVDDQPINGTNYYRLRQVNKDGSFSYSKVVNAQSKLDATWHIFPNPVVNGHTATIERFSELTTEVEFQLFNTKGQLLKAYLLPAFQSRLNINLETLPAGVYVVNAIGGERLKLVHVE